MHTTERTADRTNADVLEIRGLDVHYGQAHALQDVALSLGRGVLAVVGRNGMGKTTLCKAITGLVPGRGSIRFEGRELLGLPPDAITHRGVAYVPQGRRVWRSLTVDETLQLAARTALQGAWTVERVYQTFPRLAERRGNGGGQLSGGEQQMLAIGRALLFNPRLLVMDEPTEGLAPVIVEQVATLLSQLAQDGSLSVLLIEQNLGVALEVADRIAVMVNGRIAHTLPAEVLAADQALQRRLLGVGDGSSGSEAEPAPDDASAAAANAAPVFTLVRRQGTAASASMPGAVFTLPPAPQQRSPAAAAPPTVSVMSQAAPAVPARAPFRIGAGLRRAAYVVGTFDTKGTELMFLRQCLDRRGLRTVTVDLSTRGAFQPTVVSAREVAGHHPQGERAVFGAGVDPASAQAAMAEAFARFLHTRDDLAGVVSVGGASGRALVWPGLRSLPVEVPKVVVSTSGPDERRAGASAHAANAADEHDPYLIHMPAPASGFAGLTPANEPVLRNAAHALAGMVAHASMPVDAGPNPMNPTPRRLS